MVWMTASSSRPIRRARISWRPASTSNRHSAPSFTIGMGSGQPALPASAGAPGAPGPLRSRPPPPRRPSGSPAVSAALSRWPKDLRSGRVPEDRGAEMNHSSPTSTPAAAKTAPAAAVRAASVGLAIDLLAAIDTAESIATASAGGPRLAATAHHLGSAGTVAAAGALLGTGPLLDIGPGGALALAGLAAAQFVLKLLTAILVALRRARPVLPVLLLQPRVAIGDAVAMRGVV